MCVCVSLSLYRDANFKACCSRWRCTADDADSSLICFTSEAGIFLSFNLKRLCSCSFNRPSRLVDNRLVPENSRFNLEPVLCCTLDVCCKSGWRTRSSHSLASSICAPHDIAEGSAVGLRASLKC